MALAAPTSVFGIQNPWQLQPPATPTANEPDPTGWGVPVRVAPVAGPGVNMTPGYTAQALSVPRPTGTTTTPTQPSALSAAAPALAGLQAGQVGTQAYDTKSGVASALGAAAAGAVAGGVVGGPVGAAVGGGLGLVSGGLNAWMTVGKENKANRDRRKLLSEAKMEQKRRDDIARNDAVDELAYERKKVEEATRLAEWQQNRGLLAEAAAKSKAHADEFISRGYTT